MQEKFGSSDRIFEIHQQLIELGKEAGIEFDFEAIEISPNTLDAHRLIRWASQAKPNVQDAVVGILFSYYFEQGKNIGDHQVLLEAAEEAGMDVAIVASLLPTDADARWRPAGNRHRQSDRRSRRPLLHPRPEIRRHGRAIGRRAG